MVRFLVILLLMFIQYPKQDAFDQHGNDTYNTELDFILEILESGTSKSKLFDAIKKGYENYDNNRTNGDKSSVKKSS